MRATALLVFLTLSVAVTNVPARADCLDKHVDLEIALQSLKHSHAYYEESQSDLGDAALSAGQHWLDMAENEECSSSALEAFYRELDAEFNPVIKEPLEVDPAQMRLHKEHVAAAYAKKHPSKWALANPGLNPFNVTPKLDPTLNEEATTLNSVAPDTPPEAQQQGITGVVNVVMTLDEHSHVTSASIQSSPSTLLNDAALTAARESTFRTEIRNGKPISATYVFAVEFNNN
jgi:TonB family protein